MVCLIKKGFALCPSRKTSLSNAIYGNSSERSDDVIHGEHAMNDHMATTSSGGWVGGGGGGGGGGGMTRDVSS